MNKNVSFLHIGDIHFNSRYLGIDEKKRSVRLAETKLTLKKIICENPNAKIILFSGDIFDGEYDESTIKFLCNLFYEESERQFFIACGNHDYLTGKCMQTLKSKLPSNAYIFDDSISSYHLSEYDVTIYGCSFLHPHCHNNLLENFKVKNRHEVNIMLIHGDLDTSGQYNPINLSSLSDSGIDYLALGHRHCFSGIKCIEKTTYAYPGILEPRGFDECGKCGVIKGNISDGKISAEFLPCSAREYHIVNIDITSLSSDVEIIEKINAELNENNLYRVILTGKKSMNTVDLSLYEEMADAFYCEIEDKTANSISIFDYSGENTLQGKAVAILEKYINSNEYDKELIKEVSDTLTEILCLDGNE